MTDVLFGRANALARFAAAVADPAITAVFLRGPAGSGKTALAEAGLAEAVARGAICGAGKYADGSTQAPLGAVMTALSNVVGEAFERLYDPEAVGLAMLDTLGPAAAVLAATGFEAGVSTTAPARELIGRREGATRVIDAALKLLRWLATFDAPIILFIDDWRRGGPTARDMLIAFVGEARALRLTLVLAERDTGAGEPSLMDTAAAGSSTTIVLGGLDVADRVALFDAALNSDDGSRGGGAALVAWLGDNCPVLPFDILGAARALEGSRTLTRDGEDWRIDAAAAARLGREDLARTLVDRMRSLAVDSRRVALAAALWGDAAPRRGLALAVGLEGGGFEAALAELRGAAVIRTTALEVIFLHDRMRSAVLAAPDRTLPAFAGELAERLALAPSGDQPSVATAALHFRQMAGLDDVEPAAWRDHFASGAKAARARLDFDTASRFAESAWTLRARAPPSEPAWDRLIIREAVLAAADGHDPAETLLRVRQLLAVSTRREDLGDAYELAVAALRRAGDADAAWSIAKRGMAQFGVALPRTVGMATLMLAGLLWKVERRLRVPRSAAPRSPAPDAFTRIANVTATLAFERSPRMAALVALRGSRRAAPAARTPFWMATDTFLSAMTGDLPEASRLGKIAAEAVGQSDYEGFARAATLYRALYWGPIWTQPQASLRDRCREIRDMAMAEGDLVQAAVAIRNGIMIGWRSSASLTDLALEVRDAERELRRIGDADALRGVADVAAAVASLTGDRALGGERTGPADGPTAPGLLVALECAAIRGDWAYAADLAARNKANGLSLDNHPGGVVWRFHQSLARLRTGRAAREGDLAFIRRAAGLNPVDHRAKLLLLEAESLRRSGDPTACLAAFSLAVIAGDAGSSRLEAGLAAEAAAQAARAADDLALAEAYDRRAQAIWIAWGAAAKVRPAVMSAEPPGDLARRLVDAQSKVATAERTDRAKSRLLAEVGHELRTPLQAMQSLLDLAAGSPGSVDLVALGQAFGSLKDVINDLTDLGAMSSGDAPIHARATDIVDLVRSECVVAGAQAARNGSRIVFDVADGLPGKVDIDGSRLRQVVRNLLSNASKYGQGGAIVVRLARVDGGAEGGDEMAISVEDEGPGFTDAERLRLFEPFERGSRVGDDQGLGLGLALSRRIAIRLGGALSADNRPEGGARFVLRLPLAPAAAASDRPPPPIRALRVLVADDVGPVRRLVGEVLRAQGHGVTEAADGATAIDCLEAGEFDVAIVDLAMPGGGGLEVIARLRSGGGARASLPFVVLTASGDPETVAAAHATGADLVLRKPVSAAELRDGLETLFGGRSTEGRPGEATVLGEMMRLSDEARAELRRRVPKLLQGVRTGGASAAEAHAIAGLAAQFGWRDIAAAADEIERSLRIDGGIGHAHDLMAAAFAAMAEVDQATSMGTLRR